MDKKSIIFPEPILNLPEADIPLKGIQAYLSQGENHQIIFMEFSEDVDLPEHSHESQWGIVLEGRIELTIDGIKNTYQKGERYFIPKDVKHSGKIYAGYADMTYFDQKDRYKVKPVEKEEEGYAQVVIHASTNISDDNKTAQYV